MTHSIRHSSWASKRVSKRSVTAKLRCFRTQSALSPSHLGEDHPRRFFVVGRLGSCTTRAGGVTRRGKVTRCKCRWKPIIDGEKLKLCGCVSCRKRGGSNLLVEKKKLRNAVTTGSATLLRFASPNHNTTQKSEQLTSVDVDVGRAAFDRVVVITSGDVDLVRPRPTAQTHVGERNEIAISE